MIIGGIQKLSMIDYPDNPSVVLFTCGCNLDCHYCHNPELKGTNCNIINIVDVLNLLKRYRRYLEHVVITGGEPTIHTDLPDFIYSIKKLDYKVKLDTNGTIPLMDSILKDVDFIAMDLKAPLIKYKNIVNKDVDFNILLDNRDKIEKLSKDFHFRTTLIPELSDDDVEQIRLDFKLHHILDRHKLQKYIKREKIL